LGRFVKPDCNVRFEKRAVGGHVGCHPQQRTFVGADGMSVWCQEPPLRHVFDGSFHFKGFIFGARCINARVQIDSAMEAGNWNARAILSRGFSHASIHHESLVTADRADIGAPTNAFDYDAVGEMQLSATLPMVD
jgi:hypothetical protein